MKVHHKTLKGVCFAAENGGGDKKLADGTKLGCIILANSYILQDDPMDFVNKAINMKDIRSYSFRIRSKNILMLLDYRFSGSLSHRQGLCPEYFTEKNVLPVR